MKLDTLYKSAQLVENWCMSVIPATQKAEAKMKAAWATQRILDQGGQFHENLSENLEKSTHSYVIRCRHTEFLLYPYVLSNFVCVCASQGSLEEKGKQ